MFNLLKSKEVARAIPESTFVAQAIPEGTTLAGPDGPDAEFNYALLDLGALVCRAGTPSCHECPVRRHCATGADATPPPQLQLEG